MSESKSVLVSVSKNHMTNKRYYPQILAKGNLESGEILPIKGKRGKQISKKKFRKMLKDTFQLNRKQSKLIIDSFLNLDVMREDDDNYYILSVKKDFVKIYQDTLEFVWSTLNMKTFKVYCYLLNKWNINQHYNYDEPYRFSIKELCEGCGFNGDSQCVKDDFTKCVLALRQLGFIDCEEKPSRCGEQGGYYRHLTYVDPAPRVVKAAKEMTASSLKDTDKVVDAALNGQVDRPLIFCAGERRTWEGVAEWLEWSKNGVEVYREKVRGIFGMESNEGLWEIYKNDAEEWLERVGA